MRSSLKSLLVGVLLLTTGSYCHASFDGVAEALASGDSREAMSRFEALPAAERTSFRGRLLEAELLVAMNKSKEAEQRYRLLIDKSPSRPEPYNNLAVLYADRGELDKAMELLERAMQTNASYATVRDNLRQIYLEKSLTSYAKALRIKQREESPRLQSLYKPSGSDATAVKGLVAGAESSPSSAAVGQSAVIAAAAADINTGRGTIIRDKVEPLRVEKARAEEARIKREQAEQARLEKARAEEARIKREQAEQARLEKARAEETRIAREQAEQARLEKARAEEARLQEALAEQARIEMARAELARIKEERAEQARLGSDMPSPSNGTGQNKERETVLNAVKRWARAWQEQKVAVYLAAYAKEFMPPDGLSRADWEVQRHRRLRLPEEIEVGLDEIKVEFDYADHARVEFLQRYRSDRYHDKTRKRLHMVKHQGQWQIREEVTLEVID